MTIAVNKVRKGINKELMANFVGYTIFQNLHTFYRDFLH